MTDRDKLLTNHRYAVARLSVALCSELCEVFEPTDVVNWFREIQPRLDYRSALDAIAQGDGVAVCAIIRRILEENEA